MPHSYLSNPSPCDFDPRVRLLDKREIAAILKKSQRAVDDMIRNRTIPYIKLGHHIRFRLREVERALDEHFTVREVAP